MSSRSSSASPGCPASNRTASDSRRGACAAAGISAAASAWSPAPGASARSMSRITVPSSARDSRSSVALPPRRSCSRASSSRRLSWVIAVRPFLIPLADGGVESRRQRGIAADEILPGELPSEALALLGELQSFRRERHHERLALHVDLAFQLLVEFRSHCVPSRAKPLAADGISKPPASLPPGWSAVRIARGYFCSPSDL